MLYYLGKFIFWLYLKIFNRVKVYGAENIPQNTGVLLCSNHVHNLDPPLVGATCPRIVRFMAKAELFDIPVLGSLIHKVHAFPIKRGMSDRQALRQGLSILKNNEVLGIFPEGTRSKTGELGKGLAGVGFFALRSDADVVPAAVIGSYKLFNQVKIYYGSPIDFSEARKNKISPEEATELIMKGIEQLLEKYKY